MGSTLDINRPPDIHSIFLDWSRAFDKVPHHIIISKIKQMGIGGSISGWIQDFLNNRLQSVVYCGNTSEPILVVSGVPQGSILGPLLFILFTNDLQCTLSSQTSFYMYADDTVIFRPVRSPEDASLLQIDLDNIVSWSKRNGMELNPNKSVLPISRRSNPFHFSYNILGSELTSVNNHKYLGVIIQSDLKWHLHINLISSKASKTIGFIKRTS